MKKFSLLFFLLISGCSHYVLVATPCTPKANVIGTSFWKIADNILAGLCSKESHIITQTDIPFTVTESGLYCIAGTISSASNAPTPIVITADNVFLDLNQNVVTKARSTDGTPRNIIEVSDVSGVKIFNGSLHLTTAPGTPSGAMACTSISTSTAVILEDLFFVGDFDAIAANEGVKITQSTACLVKNCIVSQASNGYNCTGISSSSFHTCQALNCTLSGFVLNGLSQDVSYLGCIAYACNESGFVLGAIAPSITIENVSLKKCIADSCSPGGSGSGFALASAKSVSLEHCIANHNGASGFLVTSTSENIFYFGCIANNNVIDGFNVAASSPTDTNILSCKASGNGAYGFRNNSGASHNAFSCYAAQNGSGQFLSFATPVDTILTLTSATYWRNVTP